MNFALVVSMGRSTTRPSATPAPVPHGSPRVLSSHPWASGSWLLRNIPNPTAALRLEP
uniref:Uncharacterized protein n=1 Tax=Equus asinus asinus TaxID=83772 RepID=A0A8C4MY69_EQUAS